MKKYFISILLCVMIGGSLSVVFNLLGTSNVYINGAVIGAVCGFFLITLFIIIRIRKNNYEKFFNTIIIIFVYIIM